MGCRRHRQTHHSYPRMSYATVLGPQPGGQEFFKSEAKPPRRFRDRAGSPVMTESGWIAERRFFPPNRSLLPTSALGSISSASSTAPPRSWITCRSLGLHGRFGAGLRLPNALALAADVVRQAFQRLAFAHRPCRAMNARRQDALAFVRAEIEVASFNCDALRNRGSGRGS